MSDIGDRLEVRIQSVEGLGLVGGILPTTFVEVVVGSERRRTPVITENKNPRFDSDPLIFDDLVAQNVDAVMIYVKHLNDGGSETPLGVIVIPTDTPYNSPLMELESVFDLEHTTGMSVDSKGHSSVRGKVHIKMLYVNVNDPEVMMDVQDVSTNAPNELVVKVIDANNVGLAQGYKNGVDAIVEVQVGDLRQTTRVSKRSLTPEWNDILSLAVDNGNELIDIWLKHSSIVRNVFLGRVRTTVNEVAETGANGLLKSFPLYNEALQYNEMISYGTIQLHLTWKYSEEVTLKKAAAKKKGLLMKAIKSFGGAIGAVTGIGKKNKNDKNEKSGLGAAGKSTTEEEEEEQDHLEEMRAEAAKSNKRVTDQFDLANMSPFELSTFLDEQRRERKTAIAELLEAEPEEIDMPEGDYNIMMHLLELNDIRTDASGRPPNPMVYIECFGKKFHSKPLYGTTSDFYDEVFYFTMPAMKKEQIAEAFVKMTVVDHFKLDILKKGWFDSTIGVYTLDLATIYNNKNHELHRKWGTLRDPHNDLDSGPQGLIKYSAVCLGPGDVQRMHDPQKEEDQEEDLDNLEDDLEKTEGAGVVDIGMSGRQNGANGGTSQTLQFLVIGVLKVDGLPGFDRIWSEKGLYAYVQCEFAGCKPVKTTKVGCKGTENLCITFEEELWLPVWTPTLCKRVAITIKNSELGRSDQTIATTYIDFQRIRKYSEDPVKSSAASWLGYKGTYEGNDIQLLHFYGANPRIRTGPKAARFMNKFPNHGSAYRGTLVCSTRIVKHSRITEAAHKVAMSYEIPETLLPEYCTYNLKAMVYQGSDFGSKGVNPSRTNSIFYATEYCLSITVGEQEIRTSFKEYNDGSVDWLELCEKSNFLLPKDLSQLPDAFVTVYKGTPSKHTSVAFLRIKTIELLAQGTKSEPRWYDLKHDQSHKRTSTVGFPGSVLLKLSLVNMQDIGLVSDWEAERKKLQIKKPYCLRVMIYQCRTLPAVTDNALIDPYAKVRFCGAKQKTKTKNNTQNPIFFETLDFNKLLPSDLRLAPNLLLQIWDNKMLSKFPVAALRVAMSEIKISKNVSYQPDDPPEWHQLHGVDGEGNMGEILVRFILIEKNHPDLTVQIARKIEPNLRKCFLDIHAIGLRGLLRKGISNIRMPYLYFDLHSSGYGDYAKSEPSRLPTAVNPNFLDRHILQTYIPDDPLYCPVLEIHVYDVRYTTHELLGIISVDLRTKLPWNSDEYIPPRQHQIMSEAKKAKETLVKEKGRLAIQEKKNREKARMQNKANLSGNLQKKPPHLQAIEDDENEEEQQQLHVNSKIDEGGGVFPLEAGANEVGTQYATLPPIVDENEEEEARRRRQVQYEREREMDAKYGPDGPGDDELSEEALVKKLIDFPTAWTSYDFLSGRDWWIKSQKNGEGGHLEDFLQTYAFENYDLMRGHVAFNNFRKRKNTLRKVGSLKAVIRVTTKNPRYDEEFTAFAKAYRKVEKAVVRVYVIKAQHLLPTDIFGSSSSKQAADPYIRIKLGETEFKDVSNVQKRSLNPDFFSCYEFQTTIAGPTKLQLGVWDKNFFTNDTLMGETIIDLEDRWFHPKWSALAMKPAEVRTLYKLGGGMTHSSGNNTSQGLVTMWVDVFTQAEASLDENSKVDVSGPARQKFQLRVVTWRSQDVPNMDGNASDLFMRYSMQGSTDTFMTDTHWRCKDGNGSWNYRTLIPLELPIKKREEGRLKIVMMERNILTANTLVGTNVYNLYDWFMLAYKRQSTVFPLKEKREALRKYNRMLGREPLPDGGTSGPGGDISYSDSESEEESIEGNDDDNFSDGGGGGEMLDDYNDKQPLLGNENKTSGKEYGSSSSPKNKKKNDKDKTGETPSSNPINGDIEMSNINQEDDDDEKPSNIGAIFNQINVYLGVGDSVADDADWFDMTFKDNESENEIYRGRIAISISIVPEIEYENDPVGSARNEPNKDPYLPPPNGRLSFSLNPMAIFYELCSPRVICCIVCCLCCVLLFSIMMLVGTQLSGWLAFLKLMKGDI
jgi:hypothetical protein